ncbi:MAG: 4-(cytidine 5'-diphospho)-2-C-methyl-D-erythritol kinase [Bacteroidia bacterium]|nr:4-(cytidine 5'-diphospho)-2-C-methyl-D-erythritol kinase [Bacteroidia bacterium]
MICFPNAKVNFGLYVSGKRADGFHDIASIFIPVDLRDALEFIESKEDIFNSTGNSLEIAGKENLCVKALELIRSKYKVPAVHIHLHKNIPDKAGLGGGSADASFMLRSLNEQFNLDIAQNELLRLSSILGSDCPFFIDNRAALVTGRGEKIRSLEIDLSDYYIVIVKPSESMSTVNAFANISIDQYVPDLQTIINSDANIWKDEVKNVFEENVFQTFPILQKIKNTLYQKGATYSSMTGSGTAIYALFKQRPVLKDEFSNCFKWIGRCL